ncbi:MAG: hypothetical protein WBA57_03605 [Elainellaceae cyanobacterium]
MKLRIQHRLQKLTQPGLRPRSLSGGLGRNLSGAIALASALFVLPACSNPSPMAETDESASYESEVAGQSETPTKSAEETPEYVGEIVTVSGEIQALYDPDTFLTSSPT